MQAHSEFQTERIVAFPRSRLNDAQLARAIAQGDRDALTTVWARYSNDVRRVVESCGVAREPAAKSLVRAVFLTLFRKAHRLERPEALRAHLFGIAIRLSSREQRKRPPYFGYLDGTEAGTSDAASARACAHESSSRALRRALQHVPVSQRLAFVLHYGEELPLGQVALALGTSSAKASLAVARARDEVLYQARIELTLQHFLAVAGDPEARAHSAFRADDSAAHALGELLRDTAKVSPSQHYERDAEGRTLLIGYYANRRASARRRTYALFALAAALALVGCALLWHHLRDSSLPDSQNAAADVHGCCA